MISLSPPTICNSAQQVGLDVAFAVARPIAGKIVVAVSHIQGLIGRQRDQNRLEVIIRAADS
nr:hypothetical protein [Salmonella sp.]